MALFPLPSASQVRTESRLRPEQVDADFLDVAALDADIVTRIGKKATIVEAKLQRASVPFVWPLPDELIAATLEGETPDDVAAETAQQQELATQATSLFTLASLYGSAGQLNSRYFTRAQEYKEEAQSVLDLIIQGVQFVKGKQGVGASSGGNVAVSPMSSSVPVQSVF